MYDVTQTNNVHMLQLHGWVLREWLGGSVSNRSLFIWEKSYNFLWFDGDKDLFLWDMAHLNIFSSISNAIKCRKFGYSFVAIISLCITTDWCNGICMDTLG